MAKNRQLMERWRKWKIKKRRTYPKAFSSKARWSNEAHDTGYMRDGGAMAYGHRARSFRGNFDFLSYLFTFPDNPTVRGIDNPLTNVEVQLGQLQQADPSFRVLTFSRIYLSGGPTTEFSLSLFFGGLEVFYVERKANLVRRTIVYSDIDRAKRLLDQGRLKWLPATFIPSPDSSTQ